MPAVEDNRHLGTVLTSPMSDTWCNDYDSRPTRTSPGHHPCTWTTNRPCTHANQVIAKKVLIWCAYSHCFNVIRKTELLTHNNRLNDISLCINKQFPLKILSFLELLRLGLVPKRERLGTIWECFLQMPRCPSCRPTNSVRELNGTLSNDATDVIVSSCMTGPLSEQASHPFHVKPPS